jgi:protein-S-isoprenylcysteine O-methyltransferase Ste14
MQAQSPYRVLLPVCAVILSGVLRITAPWRRVTLYENKWAWIAAAILFAIGIWFYKAGSANFSLKQLQGTPEVSSEHGAQILVTTGIRAYVRHPMYLAHLCEMLFGVWAGLVVCWPGPPSISGAIVIRLKIWNSGTFRRILPRVSQEGTTIIPALRAGRKRTQAEAELRAVFLA